MNPNDQLPGAAPDPRTQTPKPRERDLVRDDDAGQAKDGKRERQPGEADKGPGSASADVGMTADGDV